MSAEERSVPETHRYTGCMGTLLVASEENLTRRLANRLALSGEEVAVVFERRSGSAPPPTLSLVPLRADPTAIDFGLPGVDYRALVESSDRVIFACVPARAETNEIERHPIVRAASEVLEFVKAGGGRAGVTMLSSLLVFGDAPGPVAEADFRLGQRFSGVDEEALAVAERILRRVGGLAPLKIVRIAPLVGDVTTREFLPESGLLEIVRRAEAAPGISEVYFSDLPVRFETTDRAADALFELHRSGESITTHLVDKNPLSDRALLELLGKILGKEFRDPLSNARGRRAQSALFELRAPEKRAFAGWGLSFYRGEAERCLPSLLDRDAAFVLDSLVRARQEART